jgi:hypothetical protein
MVELHLYYVQIGGSAVGWGTMLNMEGREFDYR